MLAYTCAYFEFTYTYMCMCVSLCMHVLCKKKVMSIVCVCVCVVYMLSALQGVVVEEEGWRKAAGPAGVSRCGATELTGLGPSGRMCANHNLFCSAAAPSAVWLWCMGKEERETLWVMKNGQNKKR